MCIYVYLSIYLSAPAPGGGLAHTYIRKTDSIHHHHPDGGGV